MTRSNHSAAQLRPMLASLQEQRGDMTKMLRRLVEHESPSDDKPACDALAEKLAGEFSSLGGRPRLHRAKTAGNHLQIDFAGQRGAKPVLVVGHYDTVYGLGTLQSMPFRENRDRISGPGVLDMKGGIVQIYFAIAALRSAHATLPRPITVILVSDEEVGSESSRELTESLAKKSAAALVCEPAAGLDGALKTARKGVGDYSLHVRGVASHAGLDFEKGQSAIVEMARLIGTVSQFTDLTRGLTVNPGVVRGGTRGNVVAAEAVAQVDVRVASASDAKRVEQLFSRLKPKNRKCTLTVSGGINRPPMERKPGTAELFALARTLGDEIGLKLKEMSVGGASDGNFTSALVPTLDGLGAVGDGAHAQHEFVFVEQLPKRAALLAGLLQAI